jgi:hypothetical protein
VSSPTPNALAATQLGDLVTTTLRDLGEMRFTEIASSLQRHTAMRNLLKKNRVQFESGYGFQWNVMVNMSAAAANVGLGASDDIEIRDSMVTAQADWRNTTTNYAVIGQEQAMNREPRRIVDLVKERRIACMIGLAELFEGSFWGSPVASTDTVTPWGVNTWFVKNATQGFNGGAPSGYTSIGLNPTVYPNWKNYTDQYTSVSVDDFIRKARRAATFTDFQPPVDGIPTYSTGSDDYGFYTNYGVIGPLEESLVAQNQSLGNDVASTDGRTLLRRTPVTWVPKLEADTTNPFFGIPWMDFKTFILKDWWLKETFIPNLPGQHTISGVFVDCTYQWVTRNRRTGFVLATGTTYPS